jgi:hypothetical protein
VTFAPESYEELLSALRELVRRQENEDAENNEPDILHREADALLLAYIEADRPASNPERDDVTEMFQRLHKWYS